LNPIYWYVIYIIFGTAIIGGLIYLFRKRIFSSNRIIFSKDLDDRPINVINEKTTIEVKNEIRIPTQAEFDLEDPNEDKFLSIHLLAKAEKRPDFNLLHTKLSANGLSFDDRKKVFIKMNTNHVIHFYLLNGEAEKDLSAETSIAILTFLLPLKGQNNILKVFENMITLARNLATSFEMKLLDDDFNPVSDQTVANYKERAAELDINLGNNVARRRIK